MAAKTRPLKTFAKEQGLAYHETSAKSGDGCDELRAAKLPAFGGSRWKRTSSRIFKLIKDEILKLKDGHTKVVDLGGKFVMPGFNDAHAHMPAGGFLKLSVDLVGTKSLQEMQQRIAERVKTTPPG